MLTDDERYNLIQWRKRFERQGWRNADKNPAPRFREIEYHAVWQGRVHSGRCMLSQQPRDDEWRPGSHVYLIQRKFSGGEVWPRVWRYSRRHD